MVGKKKAIKKGVESYEKIIIKGETALYLMIRSIHACVRAV